MIILIVGRPASGKTTLMKKIIDRNPARFDHTLWEAELRTNWDDIRDDENTIAAVQVLDDIPGRILNGKNTLVLNTEDIIWKTTVNHF